MKKKIRDVAAFIAGCAVWMLISFVPNGPVLGTFESTNSIIYREDIRAGMRYGVYTDQGAQAPITVINLTKDSLEIEKLKFELPHIIHAKIQKP